MRTFKRSTGTLRNSFCITLHAPILRGGLIMEKAHSIGPLWVRKANPRHMAGLCLLSHTSILKYFLNNWFGNTSRTHVLFFFPKENPTKRYAGDDWEGIWQKTSDESFGKIQWNWQGFPFFVGGRRCSGLKRVCLNFNRGCSFYMRLFLNNGFFHFWIFLILGISTGTKVIWRPQRLKMMRSLQVMVHLIVVRNNKTFWRMLSSLKRRRKNTLTNVPSKSAGASQNGLKNLRKRSQSLKPSPIQTHCKASLLITT